MENIFIRNKEEFDKKVGSLKKGGPDSLHIITDFDRTLTVSQVLGKKISLSYHPVYACFKKKDYKDKVRDLFNYYQPIESDPTVPVSEKNEKMAEWWEKYFELVREYGIREEDLFMEADKTGIHFRNGMVEFFRKINKEKIPVLVFSAGVSNIIEYYFMKTGILSDNIHIIANKLLFEKGKMNEYTKPLIHSFNKNEQHITQEIYRDQIETRKKVILLGDQLGDLTMANGVDHECILKIGFLNSNIDQNIKEFSENYDALILNDGDFVFVNNILDEVLAK